MPSRLPAGRQRSGRRVRPLCGPCREPTSPGDARVAINKVLSRRGTLWQNESYDHLIRDDLEFVRAVEYIVNNPVKAGLVGWKWVYARGG